MKGFTLVELVVAVGVLSLIVAVVGGVGYVAFHFISKVW